MRRYPVIVAIVFIAGFGAFWSYGKLLAKAPSTTADLQASGTIEADNVAVTAEVSGRIAEIIVNEGQAISAGQVVVRMDDALLKAQQVQADAAVKTAEAALAKVKAGSRNEDIAAAQAALSQAIAARDGAKNDWENAKAILANPQDLNAQIDAAKARITATEAQMNEAIAAQALAEANRDAYEWKVSGPDRSLYLSYVEQAKAAAERVNAASALLDGAKKDLDNLQQMKANPQTNLANTNAAKARYDTAGAAVSVAQAKLATVQKGATTEQIAVAEAQLNQAKAMRDTLDVTQEKMSPAAPTNGIVLAKSVSLGETVQPGTTLLTLANLEKVNLRIYIPEDKLGQVQIGQKVQVKVDSFPGQIFEGQVTTISNQAEFTPRNVQTQDQRVNTVYAVKIKLSNPDLKLKPGMPADAAIAAGS